MAAVAARRCWVGRDAVALRRSADGITLEGRMRLRPGALVEVIDAGSRVAVVETWAVARLGHGGPIFHGFCRWRDGGGSPLTHDDSLTTAVLAVCGGD
jgi:hypothetical protein